MPIKKRRFELQKTKTIEKNLQTSLKIKQKAEGRGGGVKVKRRNRKPAKWFHSSKKPKKLCSNWHRGVNKKKKHGS